VSTTPTHTPVVVERVLATELGPYPDVNPMDVGDPLQLVVRGLHYCGGISFHCGVGDDPCLVVVGLRTRAGDTSLRGCLTWRVACSR
jgi:hypothetical protein